MPLASQARFWTCRLLRKLALYCSSTPARPDSRSPCEYIRSLRSKRKLDHLHALASGIGEIFALVGSESGRIQWLAPSVSLAGGRVILSRCRSPAVPLRRDETVGVPESPGSPGTMPRTGMSGHRISRCAAPWLRNRHVAPAAAIAVRTSCTVIIRRASSPPIRALMSTLSQRLAMGAIVLAALVAGLVFGGMIRDDGTGRTGAGADSGLERYEFGGEFELVDQSGERMRLSDLAGNAVMMFFGYTFCPDICPATLVRMREVKAALAEADAARFTGVFISVDPARDTPERLGQYVEFFDPGFVGLTGSEDELEDVARRYGAQFMIPEGQPAGRLPREPLLHRVSHRPERTRAGALPWRRDHRRDRRQRSRGARRARLNCLRRDTGGARTSLPVRRIHRFAKRERESVKSSRQGDGSTTNQSVGGSLSSNSAPAVGRVGSDESSPAPVSSREASGFGSSGSSSLTRRRGRFRSDISAISLRLMRQAALYEIPRCRCNAIAEAPLLSCVIR